MSYSKVQAALLQTFEDAALFASDKVAHDNTTFVPPRAAPWASVSFMPADIRVATLGPSGQDRVDGFLQVDLNYPTGSGDAELRAKVEAVRAAFPAGSRPTYDGQEVIIKAAARSLGRVVNNYFRVSVTVYFYAHINR